MTFDIRAFWLIGALGACGFGLLVLIVKKAYPSYLGRVLSLWGAANVALGGSYAIRLGGPWEGQFVYHVLSNTLVATCLSLEYWAIRDLKRQPSSTGWIVGPPLLMPRPFCASSMAHILPQEHNDRTARFRHNQHVDDGSYCPVVIAERR